MKLFFGLAKVKWAFVLFLVIPHIEVKKTCGCYCLFRFYECSRVAHSLIVLSLSTCPVVSSIFVVGSQHTRDSNKRVWTPAYLSSSSLKFSRRDNWSNIWLIWSRLLFSSSTLSLLLLGSHFHDNFKPFLCLIMIELNEGDSLLRACGAVRLPLSHPGFNPLSQELWQPFMQGHLNFPEKSGDLSGGIRTRLVPSPIWGCALWLVCLSPLPPHSCEWVCVWVWKDGESESEGMLGRDG